MMRRVNLVALALVMALGMVACGDDTKSGGGGTEGEGEGASVGEGEGEGADEQEGAAEGEGEGEGAAEPEGATEGEGEGDKGEGEGEGAVEGEGEGAVEGEGEGAVEGEGEGAVEGEGEGAVEGEGEGEGFGPSMVVNSLLIATPDLVTGEIAGFDLDGDGAVDNHLGGISLLTGLANGALPEALNEGQVVLLGEFAEMYNWVNDDDITLNMYFGAVADGGEFDPARDLAGDGVFDADARAFDEQGNPLISFQGATIVNGLFHAGPSIFSLTIPIGDVPLVLTLHLAEIQGIITGGPDGIETLTEGLIGGAARKDEIVEALNAAKEQGLEIPLDPALIITLLGETDIDTDDDGVNDAFSIGVIFTGVHAEIAGIVEEEPEPEPIQ